MHFFMFILHGQPSSHSPLQNILSHINYVFFHTLWFYCLYSTSSVVFCFCHTAATVDLGIEEELTLPPTDGADTLFGDAIKVILFLSKSSSFAAVVFEEALHPRKRTEVLIKPKLAAASASGCARFPCVGLTKEARRSQ